MSDQQHSLATLCLEKEPPYPLNKRCGSKGQPWPPFPSIKPQFLGCPAYSLVHIWVGYSLMLAHSRSFRLQRGLGLIVIYNKHQNKEHKEWKHLSVEQKPIKAKVKVKAACYMPGRHRGGRGIAVTIFNLSAKRCGWLKPHPGRFDPGRDLVPM